MAGEEEMEANGVEESDDGERHDLRSLLTSEDRDFLIRNKGCQVKVSDLEGKTIALYFSGSWCGPCRRFTPILAEAYNELTSKDSNFEIVFVSADEDDEDFDNYFSKMPWLAIPFSDEETRDALNEEFNVQGIPTLVIIDKDGEVLTNEAVQAVRDYGAEGFPFTVEKIEKMKQAEEAAKMNQTITSLLVTKTRDFLFTSNFKKVPVSGLEGKTVGLYFSLSSFEGCAAFTRRLVNFYNELKGRGENFEIVLVSLEEDEPAFMDDFEDMPWLGIPFKDKLCEKLVRYFELEDLPTLTVIGTNGKTVNVNVVELIEDYGVDAYPFTSKKLKDLKKKEKARIETQTLESLLISGDKDFVNKNDGSKVPVLDLVGKNILLYFSAHWCPPCRAFLPYLIDLYNHVKDKDGAFEIIFISSDEDEESFEEYFSQMPWLALPFWDERNRFLTRVFKISGIPTCLALNPEGKTVTKDARSLIMEHGADAYPFTKEHIKQLKDQMEEKSKNWPKRIRHKRHNHALWKIRREYFCDGCGKSGKDWSFYCKKCDFDLHPDCALDADHESIDSEDDDDESYWPKKIKHMLHKHVLVKAWRYYQCDACGVVKQGYWSYFCEECDFDLHPECALGNAETAKEISDSDGKSDDEDEDVEDEDDEDEEDEVEDDEEEDEDEDASIDSPRNMNGGKIRSSGVDKDGANVVDKQESIDGNFNRSLQLEDVSDESNDDEDVEKKELKVESHVGIKEEDEEEEEEDDEVGDENDAHTSDEKEDEEDDEDGPGMRGYACNTRDREGSESFQETLFTCKLYK